MANRKAPELPPEAIAANAAGEAKREKENQSRRKNAEKQKRFREGMKEEGYRRVTLWDKPNPADKRMADMGYRQVPAWELPQKKAGKSHAVKVKLAVNIRETSLNVAAKSPEVEKALSNAAGEFLHSLGSDTAETRAVYSDYLEIMKLLGDPCRE
jgi:hypothetical protein